MMEQSFIVEKHKDTISAIYVYDYYVETFLRVVAKQKTNPDEMTDPYEITSFWNDFWFSLPDSPAFRRNPFFQICDIAEGSYLEE